MPVDASTYVLGAAESDTGDAGDVLQTQLANGLTGLLLVARVDGDIGATGDGGLLARLGLGGAAILDVGLGDLLIGKLFNTGVGHCECVDEPIEKFEEDRLVGGCAIQQ